MFSLYRRSVGQICIQIANVSLKATTIHIIQKSHLARPRRRNPFWFVRKTRKLHDDFVTEENKVFMKEVAEQIDTKPKVVPETTVLAESDEVTKEVRNSTNRRGGVLAKKIGQYPLWLKNGEKIRTTLLQVIHNHVLNYVPSDSTGDDSRQLGRLVVGIEDVDPSLLTKEYYGLFKSADLPPKMHLSRFLASPSSSLSQNRSLSVLHFRVGDYVDVRGKTIDRGFQGVCKRHGFKGQPASHGVTKTHRRPGNIGGGGEKGRVWPGTKLPGHMGNRWRICRGLRIWRINTKYNVMWVQGSAIPGETNQLVYIYDTILPLKRAKLSPLQSTDVCSNNENIWFSDVHNFRESSILFKNEK